MKVAAATALSLSFWATSAAQVTISADQYRSSQNTGFHRNPQQDCDP
jgi:hypothetical protein